MTQAQLEFEIKRSKSIVEVSSVIVDSAKVEVELMVETAWEGTGFIDKRAGTIDESYKTTIQSLENNLTFDDAGNVINKAYHIGIGQ